MAAATSSPELFINSVGTFITKSDIGVGTVVGSAVFNVLAVPACCGLFAGQVSQFVNSIDIELLYYCYFFVYLQGYWLRLVAVESRLLDVRRISNIINLCSSRQSCYVV